MKFFISFFILFFISFKALASEDPVIIECVVKPMSINIKKCSDSQPFIEPTNLHRRGKGSNNVVQSLALDSKRRIYYSLHLTGRPQSAVINRYINIDGKKDLIAKDAQLPSPLIGHQGLTVLSNTNWLISSAGSEIKKSGRFIILFKYSPNETPNEIKTIQVFGDDYDKKSVTMPIVTPDGNKLIVRGIKDNRLVIRVYSLKDLDLSSENDISRTFKYEWNVESALMSNGYYFQGITADDTSIYMLSGLPDQTNKRLFIYSLDGKLKCQTNNVKLGKEDSLVTGNNSYWEPESLTYDNRKNAIIFLYAMGDLGKRVVKLYTVKVN